MARPVHVVILAGGAGKRMRSPLPKVLHDVVGRPAIAHILAAARGLRPAGIVVVCGSGLPAVKRALDGHRDVVFVRQSRPLGTAHAVRRALPALPRAGADVVITNGDTPLITTRGLRAALRHHRRRRAQVTVVTARLPDPAGLGRIVRDARGRLVRIVEERDATPDELGIEEVNAGQYVVRAADLHRLIPRVRRGNAQGEYYITDIVGLAGGRVEARPLDDPDEARGINRPVELLEVRRLMRRRVLEELTARGVTIVDPDLTYVEAGARVGEGTVIHPFSVVERGATIAPYCVVGPFAHLREGAVLEEGALVGNYVEVKAARLGRGTRALHLSFLGDAWIGAGVNVGAGTITANFDGRERHRTTVRDGASLGSNTVLVAPVTVGARARTGAGAVVPRGRDVAPEETVVGVPARPLRGRAASRCRTTKKR